MARLGWEGLLAITVHLFILPAVTPSDCYVTLWLPTASSHRFQTRTVKNSRNPIWNQSFYFRIHSQLKVALASKPVLLTIPLKPLPPVISQALIACPTHFPILRLSSAGFSLCFLSRISWN